MSIVTVQNLTKSYGGRPPALSDVTLDIGPGVTGLLGPNGAGKSTLIQCVLGLLPDYTGHAQVLGLDSHRERSALRRRVGFMPETDTYLYDMTGIRAVRYLGQLSGLPRRHALRRAHEVLYHVGLGEAVYRKVEEYSTGMRQRFKLAQAIVHDPELIFLDEPLSGLDPKAREQVLGLIRNLAQNHAKHIIWSSHILPDVQKVADEVVVLHQGRFRGRFPLEDLKASGGLFDVEIEGEGGDFASAAEQTGLSVRVVHPAEAAGALTAKRQRFTLEAPGENPQGVFKAAQETGHRVRLVSPKSETLEDVFHRILDVGGQA